MRYFHATLAVIFFFFATEGHTAECSKKGYPKGIVVKCESTKRSVQIVTGGKDGAYLDFVNEIARADNNLKIIPLVTKGSMQNIEFLLWLQGVDLALVQADILEAVLDNPGFFNFPENIAESIHLVAKVFEENIYFIRSKKKKSEVKTVAIVGGKTSGSYQTYKFFENQNAEQNFSAIMNEVDGIDNRISAYEGLKNGSLDATFFVVRRSRDYIRREIERYHDKGAYEIVDLGPDTLLYPKNGNGIRTVDALLIAVSVADTRRYRNICDFYNLVRSLQDSYKLDVGGRDDMLNLKTLKCD